MPRFSHNQRIPIASPTLRFLFVFAGFVATVTHSFPLTDHRRHARTNMPCFRMFSPNNNENNEFKIQTWNPFRLLVLRLGLTEPAMTSPLNYGQYAPDDTFSCAYCGATLFPANAKYDSGTGWPSFWRSSQENAISYQREWDNRGLECRCQRCSSHLGHVFLDGPRPDTVNANVLQSSPATDPRSTAGTYLPRFCINGAALNHRPSQPPQQESSRVDE